MGLLLPLRFLMYFRAASLDRIRLRCRRQAVYAYSSQAMRMFLIADARARGFGMQKCKNEIAAVVRMPMNVAIVKAFCVRRCFHMRKAGTGRGPCRGSGGWDGGGRGTGGGVAGLSGLDFFFGRLPLDFWFCFDRPMQSCILRLPSLFTVKLPSHFGQAFLTRSRGRDFWGRRFLDGLDFSSSAAGTGFSSVSIALASGAMQGLCL